MSGDSWLSIPTDLSSAPCWVFFSLRALSVTAPPGGLIPNLTGGLDQKFSLVEELNWWIVVEKSMSFIESIPWLKSLITPLMRCITLDRLLSLPETLFLHLSRMIMIIPFSKHCGDHGCQASIQWWLTVRTLSVLIMIYKNAVLFLYMMAMTGYRNTWMNFEWIWKWSHLPYRLGGAQETPFEKL